MVGLQELRRAARVLQRVAEEATARLGVRACTPRPPLVLVLSGWGAWVSAFRSGPLAWAEDLVHDIVRDGSRAGITVLVSGERELVTARFFAALPNRIFFPAGSTEERRLAWPRLPALEPIPGRVAVFGPFVPASLATGHAAQLLEPQSAAGPCPADGAVSSVPFRVEALPALVTVAEVLARYGVRGRDRGPRGGKSPPDATITGLPGESEAPVPADRAPDRGGRRRAQRRMDCCPAGRWRSGGPRRSGFWEEHVAGGTAGNESRRNLARAAGRD